MPRLLVDPPRLSREYGALGCTGVTLENGQVLRANKQGHIDVDDPKIAKQIENNPLAPGLVVEQKFHGGGIAGATCTGCGFGAFRWQASAPCPKCGGVIEKEETK
jgi:hypothetical protein